jgi:hypothetical protein
MAALTELVGGDAGMLGDLVQAFLVETRNRLRGCGRRCGIRTRSP